MAASAPPVGIAPVNPSLRLLRLRFKSIDSIPPVNLLRLRFKFSKLVRLPNSAGISPVNLLRLRFNLSR